MSFRLKTIIGIAAIEALLLFILIWSSMAFLKESNQQELTRRAETTSKLFAAMTKDAVLATDLATLDSFILEIIRNPGIVYARVVSRTDGVLAQGGDGTAMAKRFAADTLLEKVRDGVFDVRAPIEEAQITYGYVDVGLDVNQMRAVLQRARKQALTLAGIEMALTALFSFVLGMYLTRQLRHLKDAAQQIAAGQLGYQVKGKGRDELAGVAMMFNHMSARLEETYARLMRSLGDLTESEAKMRAILQEAVDGIITIDTKGRIESFNPAAERIFGYTAREIIGQDVNMLMSEPNRSNHQEYIDKYLNTGEARVIGIGRELAGRHKNGTPIPLDLAVSEIRINDRHLFTGIVRDITKAKEAATELKRYQEGLEQMVAERTRKLEQTQADLITRAMASARAQMSAMVLHNIGNAVTPAGIHLERLESGEGMELAGYLDKCYCDLADHTGDLGAYITGDQRGRQVFASMGEMIAALNKHERHRADAIEKIRQSLAYVSDTLALQQTYTSNDKELKELTDLNLLIEDALRMQMGSLIKRGITVTRRLADRLPPLLIAKNRLMQVLVNVIKNSYEAIDAVEERNLPKTITITSFNEKGRVGFTLSDSGIGLTAGQMETIFKFGQSGKGSSGMGLYYCEMFIRANNGQISLESEGFGKGATLTISFDDIGP